MATMRTILKVLFVDVALCKSETETTKHMDSRCTADGYRKFHNLHRPSDIGGGKPAGKGGLVLYKCNDGDTECQLKCLERAESGAGKVKCEIGSKYGDYRYIGKRACDAINCKKVKNHGNCPKCKGHSGKLCTTKKQYGLCSSSDRQHKCAPYYDCKDPEKEKGEPCYDDEVGFFGTCAFSNGNKLKCVEKASVNGSIIEPVAINSSDEGKCTKKGFRDFVSSYKKQYVDGLKITSKCKDGSTKCRLKCNTRWEYILGSSSGTVNCENGIYWFDKLPKKCQLEDRLPDDWSIAVDSNGNIGDVGPQPYDDYYE